MGATEGEVNGGEGSLAARDREAWNYVQGCGLGVIEGADVGSLQISFCESHT